MHSQTTNIFPTRNNGQTLAIMAKPLSNKIVVEQLDRVSTITGEIKSRGLAE